jgi:hypothetical protein
MLEILSLQIGLAKRDALDRRVHYQSLPAQGTRYLPKNL